MTEKTPKPVFKIQSRIFTKSLMLLSVILLPVIGLFQYMSFEGNATEKTLNDERDHLEYSTRINRVGSSTCLASAYLLIHLLMNNARASANWLKERQAALEETRGLEVLSKQSADFRKTKVVDRLVQGTYQAIDYWSHIKPAESTNDFREIANQLRSVREYFKFVYKMQEFFHDIETHEQVSLVAAIEKRKKDTANFCLGLNCALIFLFAIGTGLVFVFSREITERLKVVVENATRLPQREKLNKVVGGTDEIAYLDAVLHGAAEKLEQSAQFRKSLLEMVAHDMCSPLSAVNLSLAILQTGDAVSPTTADRFSQAGKKIEQLVLKANNLLSIERLCANSPELALDVQERVPEKTDFSEEDEEDEKITELSRLIRVEFRNSSGQGSEAAKRFRPGILKKGLILVLVPLTFSTVMILWASQLNQNSARFLDEELKLTQISISINNLMRAMVADMVTAGCYQLYGDPSNIVLQEQVKKAREETTQRLTLLAKDDPQIMADLHDLNELERKENERLVQFKPVVTDVRSLPTPAFAAPGRSLIVFSIKKMEKIQGLTDRQIEKMEATRGNEESVQKQLSNCLQVGITGSLIIALVMVCAFDNNISRRLKVLTANAERLPLRKPLSDEVKGRDEIWYLDYVLHDVSETLESIWQQRKVLMEVLAADLSNPLKETREILALVPTEETSQFNEVKKRHFNFATANVERVLSLVDALLTIENLEQGKIELVKSQFAAREAAQEAIISLTALAQDRKVRLANQCAEVDLTADKGRVIQVLVNFLGNAINHSPAGTTVSIDTSLTPGGVRFDVIDSGPGLSKEMRSKVFERFFQTPDSKTKGKGYGLGLAICRMIAEAHDGAVGCDQAQTGGCSFYAVFPNQNH